VVYTSATEFQRGFIEALEYARSKVQKKKTVEGALETLDGIIVSLKEQRFESLDEALLFVE
jgi:hypothetical protein